MTESPVDNDALGESNGYRLDLDEAQNRPIIDV